MKRTLLRVALGVVGLVLLAQFFGPSQTNPTSDPLLSVKNYKGIPPEVATRLESACFDCHSNETRWPWYSHITPFNYLIAADVNEGRRRMNFSEWGKQKPGRLMSRLEEIYNQVYHHEMPLSKYGLLHPEAKLSDADIKTICDWASSEQDRLAQEMEMQNDNTPTKPNDNDTSGTKK
jgi:hypothetical protein